MATDLSVHCWDATPEMDKILFRIVFYLLQADERVSSQREYIKKKFKVWAAGVLSSCCLWSLRWLGQLVTNSTSCYHTSCPSSESRKRRAALPGHLSSLPHSKGVFIRVVSSVPGNAWTQQFLGTHEFQPLMFSSTAWLCASSPLPCPAWASEASLSFSFSSAFLPLFPFVLIPSH